MSSGFKRERPISRFDVPIGATCDAVGISQSTYFDWLQKSPEFSEATTRARGQARATLIEKIRLSNDRRAHAWLLSHCWPQEFSESRILTGAPDGKPKQFDVAFVANSDKPMSELLDFPVRCPHCDGIFGSVTGEPNEADARPKDDLPEMRYNHFTRRVEPVIDANGDNED